MKKSILIISASLLLIQVSFAQVNKAAMPTDTTKNTATDKKYVISIGIFVLPPWEENTYSNYGGSLKFDYIKSKKFGLGIKINETFTPSSHSGTDTSYPYTSIVDNTTTYSPKYAYTYSNSPIIQINTSLTATYYVLGNYKDSKAGLYVESGLGYGYISTSQSQTNDYPNPTPNEIIHQKTTWIANCLFMPLTIGGSYKLGNGKIFLEAFLDLPIYGGYQQNYSNVTYSPGTYQFLTNSKFNAWGIGASLSGFTLGYSLCF